MGHPSSLRDTGSHKALLPYEVEAEQRRVYDRRVATWPLRLASVLLGLLWLTNLGWRLPWNDFVNPREEPNAVEINTLASREQPGPYIDNGNGLYHWMTLMARYGDRSPVPFFGTFVDNAMLPNWKLFGWMTTILEGTIAVSLILGLFSRFGGALAFLNGLFLYLGLGQVPGQWTWSFVMMAAFGFVFMITGPGRFLGLDQLIRPKLREGMLVGNENLKYVYWLT